MISCTASCVVTCEAVDTGYHTAERQEQQGQEQQHQGQEPQMLEQGPQILGQPR
jgi:hypothetical protein